MNFHYLVSMMVNLDNIQPGESVDEWHSLIPVNLTFKGDVGSIRVKARYLHEVIMPLKEYTSLKEVSTAVHCFEIMIVIIYLTCIHR